MHKKIVISLLILAAVTISFGLNEANAGFPFLPGLPAPPGVSVNIDGYLPPPPGVHVRIDSGRPYYVERDRRVYMRERPRYYKKRHYRREYRDDEDHDRGRRHGHGHGRHDD